MSHVETGPVAVLQTAAREVRWSLVVPVYNEADNFPALLREIEAHAPTGCTLYVVYDFDADSTVPVAREAARSRSWLRLVKNDLGRGVVHALRAGFAQVGQGPAVVAMADLSDDLSLLPAMLERYAQGYRIVCPSRYMPGGRQIGGPLLKRTLSRLAGWTLYILVGFPTRDATNNFRLYDAALVQELGIESVGGFEVALELTAKAFRRGEPICELPTVWRDRTVGVSRFRILRWLPRYLHWYCYALASGLRRGATRPAKISPTSTANASTSDDVGAAQPHA